MQLTVTLKGGQFGSQRLGQADDAVLGGDVGRDLGEADLAGVRAEVDDPPAAALPQQRRGGLRAQEDALEVHADDPIPLLLADVVERGDPDDPGAIDERIEAAEGRLAGADRGAHGVGRGHVEGEGEEPLAGIERLGRLLQPAGVQIADSDTGALVQQRARDSQAEAARAAGNQRPPGRWWGSGHHAVATLTGARRDYTRGDRALPLLAA